jgi:TRAP-type mannitol/chloroaromatic compound transport system permease small subunit
MLKKTLMAIDMLSISSGKIFSFLIIPVALLEAVEAVRRYVFDVPTDWSWELAAMLAGAMFIVGAGWVLKEERHVRTDILYTKMPRKWKAISDVFFFTVIFFVFVGVLTVKSTLQAIYSVSIREGTFSMWSPPLYPLKIIIALGFIILLLQGMAKLIRDIYYLAKGCDL